MQATLSILNSSNTALLFPADDKDEGVIDVLCVNYHLDHASNVSHNEDEGVIDALCVTYHLHHASDASARRTRAS